VRHASDRLGVVFAAVEQEPVFASGGEAVAAQELLATEAVVLFDGGEDGGTGQVGERRGLITAGSTNEAIHIVGMRLGSCCQWR
jgi:hypothetical protein